MSDTPDTKSAPAAPKDRPHVFAVRIVDEGSAPNDGIRAVTQFIEARPPPEPLDERIVILAGRRLRVVLRGPCYLDAPIDDGTTGAPSSDTDSMTPSQQAVAMVVPENDTERRVDMNLHRLLLTLNGKRAMAEIAPENAVAVLRRMKALAISPNERLIRLTVDGCLRCCVESAEVGLESCTMRLSPTVARRLAGSGLTVREHVVPTSTQPGWDGPVLDPQNDADWCGASDDIRMDADIGYRVSWAKGPA